MAGRDYPATWPAFRRWFPDEEACAAYLAKLRWPDGFVCPRCDCRDAWPIAGGRWMCHRCGRKTSVTAGTIFHRSRLPLTSWFAAMWFVCAQKNGVSALGLQRVLGFGSYQTAWAWLHKLRRAMVRPDREMLGGPGCFRGDGLHLRGGTQPGHQGQGRRPVRQQGGGGHRPRAAPPHGVRAGAIGKHRQPVAQGRDRGLHPRQRRPWHHPVHRRRQALPLPAQQTSASPTSRSCWSVPANPLTACCPEYTGSPRYSSGGWKAPSTTGRPRPTWTTTWTSSPSGSTGATAAGEVSSGIGWPNKRSRTTPHAYRDLIAKPDPYT